MPGASQGQSHSSCSGGGVGMGAGARLCSVCCLPGVPPIPCPTSLRWGDPPAGEALIAPPTKSGMELELGS